jgi:hypothetical protein
MIKFLPYFRLADNTLRTAFVPRKHIASTGEKIKFCAAQCEDVRKWTGIACTISPIEEHEGTSAALTIKL